MKKILLILLGIAKMSFAVPVELDPNADFETMLNTLKKQYSNVGWVRDFLMDPDWDTVGYYYFGNKDYRIPEPNYSPLSGLRKVGKYFYCKVMERVAQLFDLVDDLNYYDLGKLTLGSNEHRVPQEDMPALKVFLDRMYEQIPESIRRIKKIKLYIEPDVVLSRRFLKKVSKNTGCGFEGIIKIYGIGGAVNPLVMSTSQFHKGSKIVDNGFVLNEDLITND